MSKYIVISTICVLCVSISAYFGSKLGRKSAIEQIQNRDTTVIYKTIYIDKPIPIEKTLYKYIYIPIDSVEIKEVHDTSYVVLPMESKTYQGENYSLQISGYDTSLDWLKITSESKIINKPNKRNTICAGGMLMLTSKPYVIPYLEYTHNIGKLHLYGKAGYDIIDKYPVVSGGARIDILSW